MRCFFVLLLAALCAGVIDSFAGCSGTSCGTLEHDAQTLLDQYQACGPGDACEVVDLDALVGYPNCLAAFPCSAALRANADLAAFSASARDISTRYRSGCSTCAMAACAAPKTTASCVAGRCQIDM